MNPPIFIESNVEEDPKEFLDSVYQVLSVVGVTSKKKVQLAS